VQTVDKSIDGVALGNATKSSGGNGLNHGHCVLHTMTEFTNEYLLLPLCILASRDVVEKYSDLVLIGLTDAKGVNVVPAMIERVSLVFKSDSFTRQRYPAVNIEPMLFMVRGKRSHPLSSRVVQARLANERVVYFDEPVIDWRAGAIEFHFNNTEACAKGIEEGVIAVIT
jgi:hypothetical protein